jgi:hypothetical protein
MSERAERRRFLRQLQDQLTRLRASRDAIMQAGPDELIEVLRRQNRVLYEDGLIDTEQLAASQLALEELDELKIREESTRRFGKPPKMKQSSYSYGMCCSTS